MLARELRKCKDVWSMLCTGKPPTSSSITLFSPAKERMSGLLRDLMDSLIQLGEHGEVMKLRCEWNEKIKAANDKLQKSEMETSSSPAVNRKEM
jgi:hypothetical protein